MCVNEHERLLNITCRHKLKQRNNTFNDVLLLIVTVRVFNNEHNDRETTGARCVRKKIKIKKYYIMLQGGEQIVQSIKKPVRTLSIFTSMAFVKDANGISFKNRLKGHINWRKVRNFIII